MSEVTVNLTIGHLAGFILLTLAASQCLAGTQLLRAIGFIALWQLLTPVRPAIEDTLLMICAWSATELVFGFTHRWLR